MRVGLCSVIVLLASCGVSPHEKVRGPHRYVPEVTASLHEDLRQVARAGDVARAKKLIEKGDC